MERGREMKVIGIVCSKLGEVELVRCPKKEDPNLEPFGTKFSKVDQSR